MADVYSQRTAPPRDVLRYDLPENVRRRIIITLEQVCGKAGCDMTSLLSELGGKLLAQYGAVAGPAYEAARQHPDKRIQHFLSCTGPQALDFIEFFTRCASYAPAGQKGVAAVNEIFREEGIGCELSDWPISPPPKSKSLWAYANWLRDHEPGKLRYPQIIVKQSEFTHEETVKPCLHVLSNPIFAQADEELLDAFAKYRAGDYDGAITSCGAAFETVLKTICTEKRWPYDRDRDACAKLVDACYKRNLFPSFYVEVFKSVGTVRNKLGDAHGRGPTPDLTVGEEHVQHLIQFTAAHIVLLAKLAGI